MIDKIIKLIKDLDVEIAKKSAAWEKEQVDKKMNKENKNKAYVELNLLVELYRELVKKVSQFRGIDEFKIY